MLAEYLSEKFDIPKKNIYIRDVYGCPNLEVNQSVKNKASFDEISAYENYQVLAAFNPEYQSDLLCSAGYDSVCITPDGDLYPCHMFLQKREYCMGNILNNFTDLFPLHNEFRFNKFENCKQCWARKVCHICPAR